MKKNLFLLGLAVAAMTSCTNDEVVEVNQSTQKAIEFESFVNKGARAVTETTDANLKKFYVWGYYDTGISVFTNEEVTKEGEGSASTSDWNHSNTKYWTQNNYWFAAYADGYNGDLFPVSNANNETTLNTNFANGTLTINNYTVDDTKDLIADVVNVDNSRFGNTEVGFDFKHLLSKIQFQIKNTSADYKMRIVSATVDYPNAIGGLTITNVLTQGSCKVDKDGSVTWQPTTSSPKRENFVPYAATDDAISTSEGIFGVMATGSTANVKTTQEYFVMPQDPSRISFEIKAQFLDDANQVVAEKYLTGTLKGKSDIEKLEAGVFYSYLISLPTAAVPIEFKVTNVPGFTPYNNGTPIELNTTDTLE